MTEIGRIGVKTQANCMLSTSLLKNNTQDFPCGLVVKNLPVNAGDMAYP